MKRKLLSILLCLCMAITLLPTAALAIEASVTVGGVTLNNGNYAVTNENGVVTKEGASDENYNVKFSGGTLTLRDAVIAGADKESNNYGIYANSELTIALVGNNTVTAGAATNGDSCGIYCDDKLTIGGEGSLTAIGGNANGKSCGICAMISENAVSIKITDSTVTAIGGSGSYSYGMFTNITNCSVTVRGSAYVTAAGGTATGTSSNGISTGKVNASNTATLIAVGGAAAGNSRGVEITDSTNGAVTVSDTAKLVALGGTAGGSGSSYGVDGKVTYSGGLMVAKGNSQAMDETATGGALSYAAVTSTYSGKYYVVSPKTNDTADYHVATANVTNETAAVTGHITWSGSDNKGCTLNNTVIIGTDSASADTAALTIPSEGKLTCTGFNVVLGGNAGGAVSGTEYASSYAVSGSQIENNGTLVAVGGTAYGSSALSAGIYANNDTLTLGGTGRTTAIGGACAANGSSFGLFSNSAEISDPTGEGRGVSIAGSASVSKAFNYSPIHAIPLSGMWDKTFMAWKAMPQSATPTASPAAGTYTSAQSVALSCTTDGAAIYYTLDGNEPTKDSTLYNSGTPISVTETTTIKARAYKDGCTDSEILAASYTITTAPSSAKSITAFSIGGAVGTINEGSHTVAVTVPYGTSVTSLAPTIITDGKSIAPASGAAQNFTSPVTYTVTAEDDTTQTYTVTVTEDSQPVPSSPAPSTGGGSYTPALVTEISSGGSTSADNLDRLISSGKPLTVSDKTTGAALAFDTEALKGIDKEASGSVKVEVKDVSKEHQTEHRGKTVFSLSVTSGGKTISSFGGSVKVSLPYELRDGERAEEVTVWYMSSDGTMTEIPCTYDAKTKLATFTVSHFSEYMVGVEWKNPFADVKTGDWFYDDVRFANENGLFSGTGESSFSPEAPMTRAMLWTVLARMAGVNTAQSTNINYYDAAQKWAVENGITDGTGPDGEISREQLVTILWRYAKLQKLDVSVGEDTNILSYTDAESISEYAIAAMQWACGAGIVNGSGGSLMPQGSATRAQVAAMLHRFAVPS